MSKMSSITEIQAHSSYSSRPYAYRWDVDWYIVCIYRLSGSNDALQYHHHGQKLSFLYMEPESGLNIALSIEVWFLGNFSFYLDSVL